MIDNHNSRWSDHISTQHFYDLARRAREITHTIHEAETGNLGLHHSHIFHILFFPGVPGERKNPLSISTNLPEKLFLSWHSWVPGEIK